MINRITLCATGAALLFGSSALAQAQRPAAAAAAPAQAASAQGQAGLRPANPGPAIAGVCMLDEEQVVRGSAAGQAYNARMGTLTQQVEAELRAQETTLNTDVTAYRTQRPTLAAAQQQTRDQALQARVQAFETLAGTRQRELQATQQRQLGRIINETRPIVAQVYSARGCGLMLNRNAVVFANPSIDVTDAVIQQLNTRLPTITFDRERAPAAAPAASPAR